MAAHEGPDGHHLGPDVPVASSRLTIRALGHAPVRAILEGRRLADWAPDYPDLGDVVVARLLHDGPPEGSTHAPPWTMRQVVDNGDRTVVGGVGFFGSPESGELEIGYGIVASRRGRGYATEAVGAMVAFAWGHPAVMVVTATTDPENLASQRVLEKAGFRRVPSADAPSYRLERPGLVE